MRIVSKRTLREFWERYPQAQEPLTAWYKNAKQAAWRNFAEVRADYNSADYSAPLTIFDIGGNKYRLIVAIHYNTEMIFIRDVFTHAEYDRWNEARKKRKKKG